MKRQLTILCVACVMGLGCAPAFSRPVATMTAVKPGERVIIGDIRIKGRLSDWVSGIYQWSSVGLANDLAGVSTGAGSGGEITQTGGVFHAAVPKTQVYLSSIDVTSTTIVQSVYTFLPINYKIPPAAGGCQYVGTFMLSKQGDQITVDLVDTFDQDRAAYTTYVAGCDLVRGLAMEPTEADLEAARRKLAAQLAAQRAALKAMPSRRPGK